MDIDEVANIKGVVRHVGQILPPADREREFMGHVIPAGVWFILGWHIDGGGIGYDPATGKVAGYTPEELYEIAHPNAPL